MSYLSPAQRAKRERLSEAQNHRCAYCGIRFGRGDRAPTVDEVNPRALGGTRIEANQVVACILCNGGRGALSATLYFEAVKRHGRHRAVLWGRLQITLNPRSRRRLMAALGLAPVTAPRLGL